MIVTPALAAVAPLLTYPDERFPERVAACRGALAAAPAAWRADLETFANAVQGLSPGAREELYTRTFDLAPGTDGIVLPEVPHHVVPVGAVRFHVEFLRVPA